MKKLTVLKVVSIIHLILTSIWSLIFFNEMNDGKGWGILFSVALLSIGLIGLFVSWLTGLACRKFFPDQPRRIQNTLEAAFVVGFIVLIALKF